MDFEEKLISSVKDNPTLYLKSDVNYKNSAVRKEIWKNISEEIQEPGECDDYKWMIDLFCYHI